MHSRRIVHRDIKPSNVLLMDDGSVRLADFGLATELPIGSVAEVLAISGSVPYMSPETCAYKPFGFKADIWALGCVVREMLIKKEPFFKVHSLKAMFLIATQGLEPVPHGVECSPELSDFLTRALSFHHVSRPTADVLLEVCVPFSFDLLDRLID